MDAVIIKQYEREFFLVWKALDRLRHDNLTTLLGAEIAQAERILLTLMRAADCIDPTGRLDGSQSTSTGGPNP